MKTLLECIPHEICNLTIFTNDLPYINTNFVSAFESAITAADDIPGDNGIVTTLMLSTLDVCEVMELGRCRVQNLFRYAAIVYPNKPKPARIFRLDLQSRPLNKGILNPKTIWLGLQIRASRVCKFTSPNTR